MKKVNLSARGYGAMNGGHDADDMNRVGIGLNSDTLLVIKLPDWRTLRVISRSLFLAMLLLALPSICSVMRTSSDGPLYDPDSDSGINDEFEIVPALLRDLLDEGLIKKGHKGFVLGGAGMHGIDGNFEFLTDAGVDLVAGADLRPNMVNEHQVFDFMFAPSFHGIHLVDGVLKDNGLIISPLRVELSDELKLLRNFKIVYLRRFKNIMIAIRKSKVPVANAAGRRVLCGASPEKKKAALKELEDVFLEPPRRTTSAKTSTFTSRKIKFLPDLLEDSLDEYSRRVFISDDSGALDWFYKNYPMKDQQFEVYNMDVADEGLRHKENGVSQWMMENVRREDYVVMKAEAQVVEEMLRDETLCLVDELFLECKNQWQDGEEQSGSKRAYWECLALYGKVKDEGIAVHQWWY